MYCFSRFCRLCFRRDCKLLNLYTKDDDMITFNEKLKSCIPEIVCDEDRMPNFICDTCCSKLKKGYEFKLMCVKNHIALRDYAKQLLKYMENPAYNQSLFNIRATRSETDSNESDLQDKDKIVDSEHDSDCSDDENDHERKLIDESNDSLEVKDEPLALVKTNRNSESCNGENSYTPYVPVKTEPDVTIKRIKLETDSEDDSQYKGEDLTKKPGCNSTPIPESAFTDSCIKERLLPQREFLPRDVPGYNMTNDMVMKYLKLEYTEREENNRNNDVGQTAEHPENLCTADSETDCDTRHDESSTWNTAVREEPKKMKTRTKDKYRIVYTENQRLELEKEFIVSRYITTSRKIQLSASLNLSQRQIKIWFQNRRAKERKQVKRSVEQLSSDGNTDPCTTSCDTPTNTAEHNNVPLLPTKEIVEVQKELFALQRQQEVYMQQHKDTKNNIGELYKHKHELLSQRLQVLMHQQKEIGNSKQSEASCH